MQPNKQEEYIDLRQYWLILKRRWLPASAVFGFVLLLTALVTFLQKPVYQAQGKLLLKRTGSTSTVTGLGKELGQLDSLVDSPESNYPVNTQAEIINSVAFAQRTINELDLKNEQGEPLKIKKFQQRLEVKNIKGTDTLLISYKSTVPEQAQAVVNKLMDSYLRHNMMATRTEAIAARNFIESQLPKSKISVQKAEAQLREFKERNNILDLENEAKAAVTLVTDLENQIAQAQINLANANMRSAALQREIGINVEQAKVINALSQSAGVQKALADYQEVESKLANERSRYQENTPVIADLKLKQASLREVLEKRVQQVFKGQQPLLDQNLQIGELQQKLTEDYVKTEVERIVFNNQLSALSKVYSNYKQRAGIIPQLQQKQRELEREVDAAQSTYATLLKKLEEVRIAENQNVGNAQIVDVGRVAEEPVAPKKLLNFALGGVAGIILAVFIALARDAVDTSIKTLREAKEVLGYTVLGVIPNFDKIDKLNSRNENLEQTLPKIPVKCTPRSMISEIYGMIYANLKFLGSDQELRVITITSAVPKEGKSTVSANLALAIAQLGFKVLLVDADMRSPSQHQFWELGNNKGLSNLIVEQIDLETVVTKVEQNLYVLTSGVLPPNPLAILNSRRMASLVEVFSSTYDFVLIDTPPLSAAADARIIGAMTDGIVMIVQPQLLDTGSAISAKELLEQSSQNVLGMVVNGVCPENEPDSYFYVKEYNTEKDLVTSDINAVKDRAKVS
ncbi:MAG: polysaccharide biosynthesis tyrosine autokinase [Chlorogloeopsis fritschii C42_A2020_084]|uniref:GumC family protein n=1 Tax=Chlorogloeopsis fritschii TaxID=1124 RepID=UPI001A0B7877|nr:polysaccharide biosynthesis tyrosine autokinase [Chlorogloeopsis fritschii]MBF2004789.1 polysaccharide biosynthesis tyrosine autokinase [Chlorogloeopsis fritschii C42_A2020_084]